MPVHKYTLGSRFYIYSHNATSPFARRNHTPANLVAMAHGTATAPGFLVREVEQIQFWARYAVPADVGSVEAELQAFHVNHWPVDEGRLYARNVLCPDYILKKEEGKKPWRGCCCGTPEPTSSFADSIYIEHIMQTTGDDFDIVGLHNHWHSGRSVRFSELMTEIADRLAGRYTRLLAAFCRD